MAPLTLDELTAAGRQLPPSHQVPLGSIVEVVSAITSLLQHGDEFVEAVRNDRLFDFLTEHAEGVNEQLANEQRQQSFQHAPPSAVQHPVSVGSAGAQGVPAQPGFQAGAIAPGATTGHQAQTAPTDPRSEQPTYAELVAEVQQLRAAEADRQRATVSTPDAERDVPERDVPERDVPEDESRQDTAANAGEHEQVRQAGQIGESRQPEQGGQP